MLKTVFQQVQSGKRPLKWYLHGIPPKAFYKELHGFLKKWPLTQSTTKVAIGNFYLAIDKNLHEKGGRPDNIYRLIDRVAKCSNVDEMMVYGSLTELRSMQAEVKEYTDRVFDLTCQVSELKHQLEESRKELHSARSELSDVTKQKVRLHRQREIAEKRAFKLQKLQWALEEDISHLVDENTDLLMTITEVENELVTEEKCAVSVAGMSDFCIQTKNGRRYSPAIRKLYYQLLAEQVPTSKIADIIKAVIRCFNPSIDIQNLKLPQRSCASYMRKAELKTISDAHKANVLCENTSEKGFRLNTDGTTKAQRKIGAVAINDMVVSVNELPDGSAMSAVHDISRELENLRQMAHALKMPNADTINWTLLVSSTSDSASTQKRFNKLIEECRYNDVEKFGPATSETVDLVENFCSMHLGINLRKAFLSGLVEESMSSDRQYYLVDTLVHEFCKVFGKHGVPEYGCGVLAFQDFLAIMCDNQSFAPKKKEYYRCCASITLERQVGNRYFVTAANAAKILFLKDAAIHFLTYTGKDSGNKLERDLLGKLLSEVEIAHLRIDGMMYYHVYADLVTLSKSNELKKSAFDMNLHYLELQTYLNEVEHHPDVVMDPSYHVFRSEFRLYEECSTNHRVHAISKNVYKNLFEISDCDCAVLSPLIVTGAVKMREKLCAYAQDHLPGGRYWNPDDSVKKVLTELQPSNDLCESILGLNDYLTTAVPNLQQMARSNLIQLKKNKTLDWLQDLLEQEQGRVIGLAVERRRAVQKECRDQAEKCCELRKKAYGGDT